MPKDVLDVLVEQLRAAAPDYPADKLYATALQIRRDMGGERHYLKKAPAMGKVFSLGNALAAGVTLAQAFADCGVSRSSGYRLINRRTRRA